MMSVAEYVALNYNVEVFRRICHLFTVVVALPNAYIGARLSAKSFTCIIELYIYTHDYYPVNLTSVTVPLAGTNFWLSLWDHRIHTLSLSSFSCLLLWVHLSPPSHLQLIES